MGKGRGVIEISIRWHVTEEGLNPERFEWLAKQINPRCDLDISESGMRAGAGGSPDPLSLGDVPNEMLIECGLSRGAVEGSSCRCAEPDAIFVPLADLIVPGMRDLSEGRVRRLLCAVRDQVELPAVVICREPRAARATLLDGLY
jgi:hypothetical protein